MTYLSFPSSSVWMSKFMCPLAACRGSLAVALGLQQFELLLDERRARVVGRELQETLPGGNRGFRVPGRERCLAELEEDDRFVGKQRGQALVDLSLVARGVEGAALGFAAARVGELRDRLGDLRLVQALQEGVVSLDEGPGQVGLLRFGRGRLSFLAGSRSLRPPQNGELLEAVRVVRPQLRVALEGGDRLRDAALALESVRELELRVGVARVLFDLLASLVDRRAALGASLLQDVLEDVAEAGAGDAGADAENDEAQPEREREESKDPLRPAPQPGEEHQVFGCTSGSALSMHARAAAALRRSSSQSNPPLSYRGSPSTTVSSTRSGEPPKTTATAGSSHGRYGDPARETTVRSARFPGTSDPISLSRPRALADPRVASVRASLAERASGLPARARAAYSAARISSKKSNEGADAGLSVPSPTRMPASRSSRSGATPQPRTALERGQCATATSCSARRAISSASTLTQCAARVAGRKRPSRARYRTGVRPGEGISVTAAMGPVPASMYWSSSSDSATCVMTGSALSR